MPTQIRKYLVIAEDRPECRVACAVAARRARHSKNGRVLLLSILEPTHFEHWLGVGEEILHEAREAHRALAKELSIIVAQQIDAPAEHVIREGEKVSQIRKAVESDPAVKVMVLGAGTGKKGPGPLVASLAREGFAFGDRHIPVLVVPGDLTDQEIDDLA